MRNLKQFYRGNISSELNNISNDYQHNGILHISEFLNAADLAGLQHEITQIEHDALLDLKDNWQNNPRYFFSRNPEAAPSIKNDYAADDYFRASQHRTHVFFEKNEGELAVNRIGHGMHLQEKYGQLQKAVYQNAALAQLLKVAGLKRPICHLSVYIPKYQKKIGSHVNPHQENTFAYTEPQTAVVLWIALEDAYIENACMWGILGSHTWPLKYISRVDHKRQTREFQQVSDIVIPVFDPENHLYTPLVAKAGDALLFHGNFVHCSPVNHSEQSRKALSMQFIDTYNVHYPETNWITSPNNKYIYGHDL
jgi:hypothetical protein